ncbi:MAG: adenine-specific methyltransferase EcoRI family protein [Oscillospiraceae bacterium]|nr:adenine-specific methyltransferase EcoRI family protein [Oscillospiraceae bacterium]
MANNNTSLGAAKNAKKDEFYTQLSDIEKELRHYRQHFRDKVVLCNCDDPFESNFFKYFVLNFNRLGLRKLIATCYVDSPIMGSQLQYCIDGSGQMSFSFGDETTASDEQKKPYKAVVTKVYDKTGNGGVDMLDIAELFKSGDNELSFLEGDGDFRSAECIELLKQADIVVTNPPFSLFRQYVLQLMEYNKKFIVIGHQNAITYKEFFPLLKDNKIWSGYGFNGNVGFFESPYEDVAVSSQHKEGLIRVSGVMWFTNLDIKKRHEELILVKKYNPEDYPKFDNYDAINVNTTASIPCDYDGMMGVPITFLDKYNPDQFEILGITQRNDDPYKIKKYTTAEYANANDLNARGVVIVNGIPKSVYARILIRNKHPEQVEGD